MIKATAGSEDGRKFVLLGLSDMNLTKLREGKPIHVGSAELGIAHDIIIFWGATEDAMAAELTKHFGREPDRVVKQ